MNLSRRQAILGAFSTVVAGTKLPATEILARFIKCGFVAPYPGLSFQTLNWIKQFQDEEDKLFLAHIEELVGNIKT